MNKKISSFPILFALLALLVSTCAVVFPASAQAAPTSTGSITVIGTVASSYDAYQIFSANVSDGDNDAKVYSQIAWASDAARDAVLPVLHCAGMPNSQTTAQEAAEWLNTDSHLTSALSAQLARSLQSSGAVSVALNAGTTAELPCGYWLIVADDAAIAQALAHVDWRNVRVEGAQARIVDPQTTIDLGGMAKGYIADRVIDLLKRRGATSGVINLGGNVLTLGGKLDCSPWRVGLRAPRPPERFAS